MNFFGTSNLLQHRRVTFEHGKTCLKVNRQIDEVISSSMAFVNCSQKHLRGISAIPIIMDYELSDRNKKAPTTDVKNY